MPTNITDLILQRLERIEDKQDRNFDFMQERINALESVNDARSGGLKVFICMITALSTAAGWAGSLLHQLWSKA